MAKPPTIGSKKHVAEYIHDKICKGNPNLKVIQPAPVSHHNDKFWWVAKIVEIDPTKTSVGITRKSEFGFVVVSQTDKSSKFKMEGEYIAKQSKKALVKVESTAD
jgi:hypothetical protein